MDRPCRIECTLNGKVTYTEPMERKIATQTMGELLCAGMLPKEATYRIVSV